MKIKLFRGDITSLKVDAIVNAANTSLLGGGGVDGAIHRAAGNELLAECRTLNGCKTGDAKIIKGYNLPAKFVIHTVGPVWNGGKSGEPLKLASSYRRSLELAVECGIKTIAFPNISTGVYGYPKEEAAKIATQTVVTFLANNSEVEQVIFCVFDQENFEYYSEILQIN
jgi:O-acetyl-ADP-ribose deacetylase (regulator of RNase III)